MNKKILLFVLSFFLCFFIDLKQVLANELTIFQNYLVVEESNNIKIYKDNIFDYEIPDSKFLDIDENYLLYNYNNSIFLYNLRNSNIIKVHDRAYDGVIYSNLVVFESDFDDTYTCKNMVETIHYRNCYKIYGYDINNESIFYYDLIGMDNYLSDIDNGKLAYNSIHGIDKYCSSICSFMNIYDLTNNNHIVLNNYYDVVLDMSGNGDLSNNVLYFESIPNIYGCNHSQIFAYDILSADLAMLTMEDEICFNKNSEIVDVSDNYMLFKTSYGNYSNNNQINYIYSYDDKKYTKMGNLCSFNSEVYIYDFNIYCLIDDEIKIFSIDTENPTVNKDKIYVALKENKLKLIEQLDYSDNLTSKENIKVEILGNLSNLGEQSIQVKLCDIFNNCGIETILVNIIDIDITPPKIYCRESITIKRNSHFDINNFGYAIDNLDGKLTLSLSSKIDLNKKGTQIILVKTQDSSGNITYKEIELIIYDNLNLKIIYFSLCAITLALLSIIYILRVKKNKLI